MSQLLNFELGTYFKKPGLYICFFLLLVTGFFAGYKLSFNPGAEIYRNSPYSIAYMIGFLSLTSILTTTLLAAQTLFKEQDSGFILILYATPLTKSQYLTSRFFVVFSISLCCLLCLTAGYIGGQAADPYREAYGHFNLWFYIQPLLLLALPNLFLCSAIVCSVTWLGNNKLMVYLSGLFVYMIYMIMLIYSGSPMMAGSLPQSAAALALSAKTDPFGLSAFYHQTNPWTLDQKNSELLSFSGYLLLNRIIYLFFSVLLLLLTFYKFRLGITEKGGNAEYNADDKNPGPAYRPVQTMAEGMNYTLHVIRSYVCLDLKFIVKSIPFVLIVTGIVFYLSMEIYGSIDQGIRLPEQYASTALIVNRIIYNLPGLLILTILFYTHELFWRSETYRFDIIENSSPPNITSYFVAKWISLSVLIFLFCSVAILTGITFQIIYHYPEIEPGVYSALYWLVAMPLIICAGIILSIQLLINHKWAGLLISCLALFALATSLGKSFGINYPLVRFAAAYSARYSDMNGWDDYMRAFSWKMWYGTSITLLLFLSASNFKFRNSWRSAPVKIVLTAFSVLSGIYIMYHTPASGSDEQLDKRQAYEQEYRKFSSLPQPAIVKVKTEVSLYPEKNSYSLSANYCLRNNTAKAIRYILVNFDDDTDLLQAVYQSAAERLPVKRKTGFIRLRHMLQPGDTASFCFRLNSGWNGFKGHEAFNAIVNNGTFIRLSNYFPVFGYQAEREINQPEERRKRKLGLASALKKLEAKRSYSTNFINLDLTISTSPRQTAIGVGNLISQWTTGGRNYFRYHTASPIPFRFGISSAEYQIRKVSHHGIDIEVYYTRRHYQNVQHLILNACRTLDYCQSNFGAYPFKTIRFAEISSFTEGFAGTAYPATIFMTEHMVFHNNLNADRGQDVINELAGHELSHQWWGAGQLVPDDREGSKLLTETLAMYTELMLVKRYAGMPRLLDNVRMHRNIYLNERGFSEEEALYKVRPEHIHLYYSKGLVVMYRLSKLIGEHNINKALKNLLQKHNYPNPAPVSTDLLQELYKVSKSSLHQQIDELFKEIRPLDTE